VLPLKKLGVPRITVAAERTLQERDHLRAVVGGGGPDVQRRRLRARRAGRLRLDGRQRRSSSDDPVVHALDLGHGALDAELGCLRPRRLGQALAKRRVGGNALPRHSESFGVGRRDQQRIDTVGELLGHPPDVGGHDREAECQRLHHGDRQPLPRRRHREPVTPRHHADGVVAEPGEDDPVAETELGMQRADLPLLRTLADRHHADRNVPFREESGCAEQVRVVLLRPEVGDGADHELVRTDAELGPHGSALGEVDRGSVEVDPVSQRHRSSAGAPAHRCPHLVGHCEVGVVPATRHPVEQPSREAMGLPPVVLRTHDAGAPSTEHRSDGEPSDGARQRRVDVHDVVVAVADEAGELQRPPRVSTSVAHAVRTHAGRFQFADQMIFPR